MNCVIGFEVKTLLVRTNPVKLYLMQSEKSIIRKKRSRAKAQDVRNFMHAVRLKTRNGKAIEIPITAEGNRFALVVVAGRMIQVIENQIRLWQAAYRDKEINTEDLLRTVKALQAASEISYRAHGDSKETPSSLPPISGSQMQILKESLPEAYALLEMSQHSDGNISSLGVLNAIEIEAEANGITDEEITAYEEKQ